RLGRDLEGIGAGVVHEALRLLLRCRYLQEGRVDRLRRHRLIDRDALNADARTVGVEQLLHVLFDMASIAERPAPIASSSETRAITARIELSATSRMVFSGSAI